MVEDLSGVVEHTTLSGLDDFFKALAFEFRTFDQLVQVGDVGLMMLAPVVFKRFTAHGRREIVQAEGELR